MKEGEHGSPFVLVFEDLYRGRWMLCKEGVRWEIKRRKFGAKGVI